nr:hypothetical protein [uncultured Rhodoferax sp.]
MHGITLFSNGHVMQILEEECSALKHASRKLRDMSKLFGLEPLLWEPIESRASECVALGVNRFAEQIAHHLPPWVEVFHLCAEEVRYRTVPGTARDLL